MRRIRLFLRNKLVNVNVNFCEIATKIWFQFQTASVLRFDGKHCQETTFTQIRRRKAKETLWLKQKFLGSRFGSKTINWTGLMFEIYFSIYHYKKDQKKNV